MLWGTYNKVLGNLCRSSICRVCNNQMNSLDPIWWAIKKTTTNGAVLQLQTTKVDSAVSKMTNALQTRKTRIIQCQEMDDHNNITISHSIQGGLEGGRWGMRRTRMPVHIYVFRLLSIRRETQWLKRGLHIIEIFLSPNDATNMILIVTATLMLDSKNSDVICYSNSILQVIASCTHLMEFFLSPPSKDHRRYTPYYKFANVIHSMITGGPDVVNPYNFVEIFKSNHKSFGANECTYILWHILWYWCIVILFFHVELSYCCAVELRCCCIVILFCRVVLSCCYIVILSCCCINMTTHVALSYCCIVAVQYFHIVILFSCIVLSYCCVVVLWHCHIVILFFLSYCSVVLMMFLLLIVMLLSANDSFCFANHQRTCMSTCWHWKNACLQNSNQRTGHQTLLLLVRGLWWDSTQLDVNFLGYVWLGTNHANCYMLKMHLCYYNGNTIQQTSDAISRHTTGGNRDEPEVHTQ